MKLTCIRDEKNQQAIYSLSISDAEYIRPHFDSFDRLLINECETSNKVSDKLLALEMIARKVESDIEL